MTEKPSVTLQGTVDKIIEPSHPSEPGKVQISIDGGDELYREIRIENTLTDENGAEVRLKKGAEVEVTLEADDEKGTTPRKNGNKQPQAIPRNREWQEKYESHLILMGKKSTQNATPDRSKDP